MPAHTSTLTWRTRSTYKLRSVEDIVIGYTVLTNGNKVQWFQRGGYDQAMPGTGGSHLSAFLQIRKTTQTHCAHFAR